MATEIELELLRSCGTHGVKSISFDESGIKLTIAPWSDLTNQLTAVFKGAKLTSIDAENDEPEDLELPWDIIAIDCENLSGNMWLFCLRCTHIEYVFKSHWPTITT
ncbi:hypothetical protein [Paraferrimonas sp. SM1919]|uniref:hypothetical protein n=1 Tax=Paraferrimonas sp. SM1919 TaxID=2662263 RepID=UPI0013D2AB90|nr:hypothetical protein [Paraferrimonas sp. SM1919]